LASGAGRASARENYTFGVIMFLHIIEAKYLKNHTVWLKFNDGSAGEVDLSQELEGSIFKPLQDVAYFKRFNLQGHTLSWENGADFAPEFLKELMEKQSAVIL
jgi:hypothetical protein